MYTIKIITLPRSLLCLRIQYIQLENLLESMSNEYRKLVDEQCLLQELIEQMTYSLSEFFK